MHILRARDRVASAWKNGGGTTSEVAIFPPGSGLSDFGWRVSIARVERGGPFSRFPGIDRRLALLEGRLSLAIDGQGVVELCADSPPVAFPGDAATDATVIEGPVTDLNVMTRRGAFVSRMSRQRSAGAIRFDAAAAVTIACLLTPAMLSGDGTNIPLESADALYAGPGMLQNISLSPNAEFYWIEIFPASQK